MGCNVGNVIWWNEDEKKIYDVMHAKPLNCDLKQIVAICQTTIHVLFCTPFFSQFFFSLLFVCMFFFQFFFLTWQCINIMWRAQGVSKKGKVFMVCVWDKRVRNEGLYHMHHTICKKLQPRMQTSSRECYQVDSLKNENLGSNKLTTRLILLNS